MRNSYEVKVGNIVIGGNQAIIIQSMTDTVTSDINKTVSQIKSLYLAGSELIRVTVNNDTAAQAIPIIKKKLIQQNIYVPLVGDFHYNGHILLTKFPECAQTLDKYRINPGNVGFGEKKDIQFATIIKQAIRYDKPVRIGVNWGSLDQSVLAKFMNKNEVNMRWDLNQEAINNVLIASALESAHYAEKLGLHEDKIIISCKVSAVNALISIYQKLAKLCNYPLHIGLTEAGMKIKGIVASSISIGILLNQGIGDTIRVSITPAPQQPRTDEVKVCQEILQSMGLRSFSPSVSSCPGCGRTNSIFFKKLAETIEIKISENMHIWKKDYKGVENMKIAVMGCIVNGPGESKHANIGISLPGNGEFPVAPVFVDGKKVQTLRGDNIVENFMKIIHQYIKQKYHILK